MKNNYFAKVVALFLSMIMLLTMVPMSVFAQNDTGVTVPNESGETNQEEVIPDGETVDATDVTSAAELEAALIAGAEKIRITADFEIDRTFYITHSVNIFSDEAHALTRKAYFAGDIFVVGEAADGTVCEEKVILSVGNKGATQSDILVIDGNKNNIADDFIVTGTVFFVCKNGQADLYPDLTVTNCEKKGNERTLSNDKHVLSKYYADIGGAVGIITGSNSDASVGVINIYGGKYTNNSSVNCGYGGAFFNYGELYVYDGLFDGNHAAVRAGAFYSYRTMHIYKAVIQNNSSVSVGGAIYVPQSEDAIFYAYGDPTAAEPQIIIKNNTGSTGGAISAGGKVWLRNVLFEGNNSTASAGAIYSSGDSFNLIAYNCEFKDNAAAKHGGAIQIIARGSGEKIDLDIRDCKFSGNEAGENGGAVYATDKSRLYVRDTDFNNNSAATSAGAVYVYGAAAEFNHVSFNENTAVDNGGALYAIKDTEKVKSIDETTGEEVTVTVDVPAYVVMNDVLASENTSGGNGGVAYLIKSADLKAYNSTFEKNSAVSGSALHFDESATGDVYNCTFKENVCDESNAEKAGALSVVTDGTKVIIHTSTFKDNSSKGQGGAILVATRSLLDLYNITAIGNSAAKGGFMYETTKGTVVTLNGLTISGNTATVGGPIIWGNTNNAELYINKNNYVDNDATTEYDEAYWASAIYNLLAVKDTDKDIPAHDDYIQPEFDTNNHPDEKHCYTAVVTAPTCTANGYTTYSCTCGDTYDSYKTYALGHTEEIIPAVDPTCTDTGLTAGFKCSVCDDIITAQTVIPVLDHSYETTVSAPTCTENGYTTYICQCGDTYVSDVVDALGHTDEIIPAVDPTCTETGLTEGVKCSVCDDIITAQTVIPALKHSYETTVTAPTCTENGYTTYTCQCGDTYVADEVAALGHTDEIIPAVDATCTKTGLTAGVKCSVCGDIITAQTEIPVLGHEYKVVVTVPTCTDKGYTTYTCNCGDTYVADEVAAKGHTEVVDAAVAAGCTTTGLTEGKHCSACNKVLVEQQIVKAKGHTETTVKGKEATCTATGLTEGKKCSVCGTVTVAQKTVSKKAHTLTTLKAVAATCTKEGKTEGKKCSVCGTVTVAQKTVAKKAHSYKSVTTKATLTKNGKIQNKCSACGYIASKYTTVYYPKTIKLSATTYTYNGKTKTPSVTVKDSKGKTLKKDTDYTVKYASGRKNTGKYAVTITFKGNYSGTKTLYFNILPSKTSKIVITTATTAIKASWKKVTGATGYKVELLNSKGKAVKTVTTTKTAYTFQKLSKVTTYKIRVTAYKTIDKKAVYSTVSTTITTSTAPAKVTLSKVTAGSKSATATWKKVSGATGYEVMYSTSGKFSKSKTAAANKNSTVKLTIKKLTKGKKYYFKVRAYKTVDGKNIYGAWSAVKSIKVK